MVMAQATQTASRTSYAHRGAAFRSANRAEMPLFQVFLRSSHHGSTDCHCIKDGTPIEPVCGDGNFLVEIPRLKFAVVRSKYRKNRTDMNFDRTFLL